MGIDWPVKYPRNKFNAIRASGMGSKLEQSVHQILLLREKSGEIKDIRKQDCVDLGFKIRWKVDFSFTDCKTRKRVYCEAKGFETRDYRMYLKLWAGGQGPGKLEIWKGSYQRPFLFKIVDNHV